MATIRLENEKLRLDIAPNAGGSIVGLWLKRDEQWHLLTRPTPQEAIGANNPSLMASFTMAPWCNRLQDARFRFQGKTYQLQANTPEGYAQHGDVRRRAWGVVEQTNESVMLRIQTRMFPDFNYPFPFVAKIRFVLDGNNFITEFSLSNQGLDPMPAGFGFHPYFNRTLLAEGDEAQLQCKVEGVYPPMPSGEMQPLPAGHDFSTLTPLGERVIDAVYGGWDGRAQIYYPKSGVRLNFECSEVLRHLCLFTPAGKPFFAVEPLSHGLNGLARFGEGQENTGVRVLESGEAIEGTFTLQIS